MVYDVRTRPIEDSIKAVGQSDLGIGYYDYQPGNGTRYALLFTRLDATKLPEACEGTLGPGRSGWMITWVTKGKTMILSDTGRFVHYNYIAEKLDVGVADAICLAEFIGHVLGRPSTRSEEFAPELPAREVMES
jgi:hypothetical protein